MIEDIASSPSAAGSSYSATFSHQNERSSPGFYAVKLANGVDVELSATRRTGVARFSFPLGHPAHILFRVSDSENGSSNAQIKIDPSSRVVSGSVTSGEFCSFRPGYYYTLHFVAVIDQPFRTGGTWTDNDVHPGATKAKGGTISANFNRPPMMGAPQQVKGSGGWLDFDPRKSAVITARIGISYVSEAAARANLEAEEPRKASLDSIRMAARRAWSRSLGEIEIKGGTPEELTVFYTALYHALMRAQPYERCGRPLSRLRRKNSCLVGRPASTIRQFLTMGRLSLAASARHLAPSSNRQRHCPIYA